MCMWCWENLILYFIDKHHEKSDDLQFKFLHVFFFPIVLFSWIIFIFLIFFFMNCDNSATDWGVGFFCPCLIMLLLIPLDSCSMCHVGAAVFGTWIYPSNRSYQWKHLKVQSLYSFYDLLLYVSICRKTGTIYASARSISLPYRWHRMIITLNLDLYWCRTTLSWCINRRCLSRSHDDHILPNFTDCISIVKEPWILQLPFLSLHMITIWLNI